jgi:hypothetical protein
MSSLTLSSSGANDLVVESICNGGSVTSTLQTRRWLTDTGGSGKCSNFAGATAAGGTTSLSWVVQADCFVLLGASFKAYVASTKVRHVVITD